MGKALRGGARVAVVAMWLATLVACTSDGSDGDSAFRNLGKRGDNPSPVGERAG